MRNWTERSDLGRIEIYDGPDVWVIPERSVRWVRLHHPESPDKGGGEFGFRIESERPASHN